jgi:hypothetical protein
MSTENRRRPFRNQVLVLCRDIGHAGPVSRQFYRSGFAVHVREGHLTAHDHEAYGAIVHLAPSADALVDLLGEEADDVRDEEWMLTEEDGDDAWHFTVQLTSAATSSLRTFVRMLWAQANMT